MATTITDDCINCGACEPECPNNAIRQGDPIYVIDPLLCTECVGFHDYEACAAVCPVDCCVTDTNNVEGEDVLIARAKSLHPETDFGENFPSRFRKGATTQSPASAGTVEISAAQASGTSPEPAVARAANMDRQPTAPQTALVAKTEESEEKAPATEQAGASAGVPKVAPAQAPAAPPTPVAAQAANVAPQPTALQSPLASVKPAAAAAEKSTPQPPEAQSKAQTKPKKTFANELPVSFEELERQYKGGGTLNRGMGKWLVLLLQPVLGSLPHEAKKRVEMAVQNYLFFSAAGSTALNILSNMILYPVLGVGVAMILKGPSVMFSQEVNIFLLVGMMVALIEAVFRLREGIFHVKPPEEIKFSASIYGAPFGKILEPLLAKQTGLIRDRPIPVDGFYSKGFVDKLERERRYGNVYTVEDRGGAFLLRLEFPRWLPDIGLPDRSQMANEMPDYDYDLMLKDGQFIVKGRCTDEKVRKISSSLGAFPPEFTTVIPLREKVAGFAHQFENKLLEVLLVKEKSSR